MTTRKTHDADLCERIRELEKRVEELEARPTYVPTFTHYCYPGCPQHTYWTNPNPYPWTVWYSNSTDSNITITSGLHQQ